MKFRFVGKYTTDNETINVGGAPEVGGVTFEGHEPAEVENEDLIERLSKNPEFQAVGGKQAKVKDPLDHDGDGKKGGSTAGRDVSEMKALREEYEFVMGKKPFSGWNADVLREKMAAFKDGR